MKNNTNNPQLFAPLAVGFFIGAITVGAAVLVWNHDSPSRSVAIHSYETYQTSTPSPAQTTPAMPDMPGMPGMTMVSATPVADPAAVRVAARFDCLCADHCDKTVDVCTCPTAKEERAFIAGQLRTGHSEADAARVLNQKYGGLKS